MCTEEHSLPWLGASLIIHGTDVIESQEFSELEGDLNSSCFKILVSKA